MHYSSLILAVAVAVLGLVSAAPRQNDTEIVCEFLKNLEVHRQMMLEDLVNKAANLGQEAIRQLPANSGFEKCVGRELSVWYLTQGAESMIRFLKKIRCSYKRKILCNRNYQNQPKFRNAYIAWKSASNDVISDFDKELAKNVEGLSPRISSRYKFELLDSITSYINRNGVNPHDMFDRVFNSAKSKYGCTFELTLL